MKALVTGAASGIGADIARVLDEKGYKLILVDIDKEKLKQIKKELGKDVETMVLDLASTFNCMKLVHKMKKEEIDVIVNNAGFGLYGKFSDTKLDPELDMIDLNIKATHTLTKEFLKYFKEKNKGYILNVSGFAGMLPGPNMANYFATKSYILNLSLAISEELRYDNSNISISVLCPGPVHTNFNKVAGVEFKSPSMNSYDVAKLAIEKMFKRKTVIIPGWRTKIKCFLVRVFSKKQLLKITRKSYYGK